MTWDELSERIAQMTSEQRETDATVYVRGNAEMYRVDEVREAGFDTGGQEVEDPWGDILDEGHPFLVI